MILGLDCGTRTGWALSRPDPACKIYESGVQDFTKTRGESNGAMFLKFRHWLQNMITVTHVTFVCYELAHHRGGAATEIGVNLTGRVQEVCAEAKIEFTSVHTGTLKKFATGHGDASKEAMIKAAAYFLGRQPIDSDEADAVLLARYGIENYG